MKQRIASALFLAFLLPAVYAESDTSQRPDIVFIIVDDLNDWIGCLGGHPDAKSPNIDSLAEGGMLFSQAYCNAPQCRPSRTSLLYGKYPFNTGTYFNATFAKETRSINPTLQQFFMRHGYRVASGGKVFHGHPGNDGDSLFKKPKDPRPPVGKDRFGGGNPPSDGYALDVPDEEMGDYKVAQWANEQWKTVTEKPLFMSVGFYRPHRPLQVPKPWFEQFPVETIRRPAEPEGRDDWDDLSGFAKKLARSHAHKALHKGLSDHEFIVKNEQWDETIQAYHASIAFVDKQIGRFLESLKKNPRGRNTYVMLVSDHGWHLGEKKHWCKGAIWEQTTHIPFIVSGPGIEAGTTCLQPASLIDVYPSLVDLAGFEVPEWLDGRSVKPQLNDPHEARDPAISSYGSGNTSVRTERWRYIHYEDGSEELYDHQTDPNEWTNLADRKEFVEIKQRLAEVIPKKQHPGLMAQNWFDKFQPSPAEKVNGKRRAEGDITGPAASGE